jgi:RNA polymerase sigma factor (sigma-70 family)
MNNSYIKQILGFPVLTKEQERALIKLMLAGDLEAKNKLIECNLRYVYYIALKMKSKIPLDELISAGNAGLLEAIDKFNPEQNVRLVTYVSKRIKGSILDYITEVTKGQAVEDIMTFESLPFVLPEAEVSITKLLKPLSDLERKIFELHYGLKGSKKLSYAEIGKELNFDPGKVRRLEENAKLKLNPARGSKTKVLLAEIKVKFGIDLSKEIIDLKKTALLNLYGSDLWKSLPEAIQELKDGIKISQSCEYLQKQVRKQLKDGLDTLPEYIQNLMRQWKAYVKNSSIENENRLNRLIKYTLKYSTKLVEPPLGTAGTLRRFLKTFERNYKDFTIEGFEKLAIKKLRYKGQRFVRTEMAKIYNNLYVKGASQSEYVKGFIFKMSDVHKIDCICNTLNNTFISKEKAINLIPLHPNCMCYLIPLMSSIEEIAEKESVRHGLKPIV